MIEPLNSLWFQFTFPTTFFARWIDRGHRRVIQPEFDLCLDCSLLWATLDPVGIEAEIRQATGEAVFGKPTPVEAPGVTDAELDGPI